MSESQRQRGARILKLQDLPLESLVAHHGEGEIQFHRPLGPDAFVGPWNFVDYAVLPPGSSIGRHTHGADEELYVVLEGRGTMHIDGEDFEVAAGSLVLNRPGGTHGLCNDGEVPLRLLVVEVATGSRHG